MDVPFYVPDPQMLFLAEGYFLSDERAVDFLLERLGIRVMEG